VRCSTGWFLGLAQTGRQLLDGYLAGRDLHKDLALVTAAKKGKGSGDPLNSQINPLIDAVGVGVSKCFDVHPDRHQGAGVGRGFRR